MDVKGEVSHKEGILFFSSSDEEIDNTRSYILFFDNYTMVDKTLLHKLFSLQIDWFADNIISINEYQHHYSLQCHINQGKWL